MKSDFKFINEYIAPEHMRLATCQSTDGANFLPHDAATKEGGFRSFTENRE